MNQNIQNHRLVRSSEPQLSRYMNSKGARLGLPISGSFELTPQCNFDCKMCYVHMDKKKIIELGKRELSVDEWLSIASDAIDEGLLFLLLTGGEPFVMKDFDRLYKELGKMGVMLSVNSNGSILNKEWQKFLIEYPPTRLNITLYGGSDETYEKLCGKPMFHEVLANIRALHEAGISVRLNASITPDNKDDIENIYRISKEIGVHVKATTYMFPPVRVNGNVAGEAPARFTPEYAAKYMLKCQEQYMSISQLEQMGNSRLREIGECINEEGQGVRCRAGRSSFWITWEGKMIPCGMMNIAGESVIEKGFKESWKSIYEQTKKIILPAECAVCKYGDICNVCAASCLAETGGYQEKPEYICRFVKEMHFLTKEKYGGGFK